jgi:hypothetical protein
MWINARGKRVRARAAPAIPRGASIGAFIETVYNVERLHSALDCKPPAEFEADLARPRSPKPKSEMALSPK